MKIKLLKFLPYEKSDTRNAFHGSDSIDNAFDELSIVFDSKIKKERSIDALINDSFTGKTVKLFLSFLKLEKIESRRNSLTFNL